MASICPVFKWLACPVIQTAFEYWTIWHLTSLDHLNTKLIWYSDPHCSKGFNTKHVLIFGWLIGVLMKIGSTFERHSKSEPNHNKISKMAAILFLPFKIGFHKLSEFECLVFESPLYDFSDSSFTLSLMYLFTTLCSCSQKAYVRRHLCYRSVTCK